MASQDAIGFDSQVMEKEKAGQWSVDSDTVRAVGLGMD